MSNDFCTHSLSMVLRFNNHFVGTPVPEELPVRLEGTLIMPVKRSDGAGARHSDGTYRFADVRGGVHRVIWLPRFTRSYRGWISWEEDPEVMLPAAHPETVIERDLWPTPTAPTPPAMTAIRGKLQGAGVAGLEVRIAPPTGSFLHFTRTDAVGEFLFLLPDPTTPTTSGQIELSIQVEAGARPVAGGVFRPSSAGASFAAADFRINAGTVQRIVFQVT